MANQWRQWPLEAIALPDGASELPTSFDVHILVVPVVVDVVVLGYVVPPRVTFVLVVHVPRFRAVPFPLGFHVVFVSVPFGRDDDGAVCDETQLIGQFLRRQCSWLDPWAASCLHQVGVEWCDAEVSERCIGMPNCLLNNVHSIICLPSASKKSAGKLPEEQ